MIQAVARPVDPAAVVAVQQEYLSRGTFTFERESYADPTGRYALVLDSQGEERFGPALFRASIVDVTTGRPRADFGRTLFASPGAYGAFYDHWSGSPWSPGGAYVALVEMTGREPRTGLLRIVGWPDQRDVWTARGGFVLLHGSWSPVGDRYLYRDGETWHLYDVVSNEASALAGRVPATKHCHFFARGAAVLRVDDDRVARGIAGDAATAPVDLVPHLATGETLEYSLPDPAARRIFLGVDVTLGRIATARRWLCLESPDG